MTSVEPYVHAVDQWLLLVVLFGVLLVAEAAGFRIGRWRRSEYDDDGRSNFGNMQAGLFGLMGLLIAFTFAMAQARFETRKEMVVAEANAIGTAWLRADLLPEPARGEIKALFVRYVDVRTPPQAPALTAVRALVIESERLHVEIWSRVVAAANAAPSPTTALLVAATNDVIDMHGKRLAASRNHVPGIVILMVLGFAVAAAAVTGYRSGVGQHRYRLPSATFLLLVTMVIGVILDLDRPQRGLIIVDQSAMLDLRASLRPAK